VITICLWELVSAPFFPVIAPHQLSNSHDERQVILDEVRAFKDIFDAAVDERRAMADRVVSNCQARIY